MKPIPTRRPSPALIVAVVALVAALSGAAVALPGKKKVDANDLRPNVVSTKTIKANAVNGAKVRNDSLTGADVNELTLEQVPRAATAGSASTAQSAGSVSTLRVFGPTTITEGNQIIPISQGPLSVIARCIEEGLNTNTAVIAVTNEAGSVFAGDGSNAEFDPGTPEAGRTFDELDSPAQPGIPQTSDGYDDPFFLAAPSGAAIQGNISQIGDADTGTCTFFGSVVVIR